MRVNALVLSAVLSATSYLPAQFAGDGSDGPLLPTSNMILDTSNNDGVFNFTEVVIPVGVTVTVRGTHAAFLLVTGNVLIEGELVVEPGSCMTAGGESPGYDRESRHVESYDSEFAHLTVGGTSSSGHSAYCNSTVGTVSRPAQSAGGFIELEAGGSIVISGAIRSNGNESSYLCASTRASGGTIVVRARQALIVAISGVVQAVRGGGAQNGLIRLESAGGTTVLGVCAPQARLGSLQRLAGNMWSVSRLGATKVVESDRSGIAHQGSLPYAGFGVTTTRRGARWVTFPSSNQIHPYGRGAIDLLPNKAYGTGGVPQGIAADRYSRIWVACGSGELRQHDSWGRSIRSIPLAGGPCGIAIDGADRVWVACETADTLHCVDMDGTIIGSYSVGVRPRGVAVDAADNVWVTLSLGPGATQGAVAKVDSQGSVLFTVPVDTRPLGISCDVDGRAWVACEGDLISPGSRVFRISADGNAVDGFQVGSSPTSVSMGGDGVPWVVNSGNLVTPASSLERIDPASGASVTVHALPDLSIAFGDATGYQACLTFDKFGDADGDGDPNFQELAYFGDPFDPSRQSTGGNRSLSSVLPGTGMLAGGTELTIEGGPFTYTWGTTVTINGVAATNVRVVDVNTLTCETSPAQTPGRGDVVVTDPAGSMVSVGAFYYSNAGLFIDPPDGRVNQGEGFVLGLRSHPFTPVLLLACPGVGSLNLGLITLELTFPVYTVLDPWRGPIPIGTDAFGRFDIPMVVPTSPVLSGSTFSFVGAVPEGGEFAFSNRAVLTIN